ALFLGVMLLIGTRVIPWLMRRIARWESRELFLITVTALGLGIGYAAWLAGLSFAFGAFLAGLVISESDYSHQALGEVIPLRDIFAMLFFVSVGMLLDPAFLVANLGTVLWVVAIVAVAKMFIFGGITRAFGYRNVIPLASALALFQLGEFSFVLARQGLTSGVFSADTYSLILTVALVTILMTPPAFQLTQPLYRVQRRLFRSAPLRTFDVPADGLEGHVVVAGAGRVGQFVAGMLHRLHVPVVAIELNQQRVDECKQQGIPVIYGDAAHPVVLKAAAVARAHLALVTTPAMKTTQSIAQQIRTLNPELHIVARAEAIEQLEVLHDIGVYEVVQPEFEAGLEIARQALLHLDLPAPEVQRYTDAVRQDLYAPIYQMHSEYAEVHALEQARRLLEFTWVTLPEGSPLAGCSLGEAQIRSHTGATVVAIMRRGALVSNPGTAEILRAGDVLAVLGNHGELEGFTTLARPASGAGDV
ncbi:MAG: cation:proton antiporter, partial [Caldilinea sp.]|nr:cation:proton antiporter [Caldilinea sp.]